MHLKRHNWRKAAAVWLMLVTAVAGAQTSQEQSTSAPSSREPPLSIIVYDDALTLVVSGVPQVAVSGIIDADSAERFNALMRVGKIPAGSAVYLDSPGGSLAAGLELGRLFRRGEMSVSIGRPYAFGKREPVDSDKAICVSACAYAYFGGRYRFAPRSDHQFGIHQFYFADTHVGDVGDIQQMSGELVAYLHEMGINPNVFAIASTASRDQVVWLKPPQMVRSGLANEGKLALTAAYKLTGGVPYLVLDQETLDGEHKITFQCMGATAEITAYYIVGHDRAVEIVRRGIQSYFEVNKQQVLTLGPEGSVAMNASVITIRRVPLSFFEHLQMQASMGAWVNDLNGTHRTGFMVELGSVRDKLGDYYQNCLTNSAQGATS